MRENEKVFFTARPKLASYLFAKNCKGQPTINAYDPQRPAWVFEQTKELETYVAQFFGEGVKND